MKADLLSTGSLRDFFRQAVDDALETESVSVGPGTSGYLVDLLCEFLTQPPSELDRPLGIMLVQIPLEPQARFRHLKLIGDLALYSVGFFSEYLQRKHLEPDYYSSVGGNAYQRLSQLMQMHRDTSQMPLVYGELATGFGQFTRVLTDVRMQSDLGDNVGTLYETWLERGGKGLERRLRKCGMTELRRSLRDGPKN